MFPRNMNFHRERLLNFPRCFQGTWTFIAKVFSNHVSKQIWQDRTKYSGFFRNCFFQSQPLLRLDQINLITPAFITNLPKLCGKWWIRLNRSVTDNLWHRSRLESPFFMPRKCNFLLMPAFIRTALCYHSQRELSRKFSQIFRQIKRLFLVLSGITRRSYARPPATPTQGAYNMWYGNGVFISRLFIHNTLGSRIVCVMRFHRECRICVRSQMPSARSWTALSFFHTSAYTPNYHLTVQWDWDSSPHASPERARGPHCLFIKSSFGEALSAERCRGRRSQVFFVFVCSFGFQREHKWDIN